MAGSLAPRRSLGSAHIWSAADDEDGHVRRGGLAVAEQAANIVQRSVKRVGGIDRDDRRRISEEAAPVLTLAHQPQCRPGLRNGRFWREGWRQLGGLKRCER